MPHAVPQQTSNRLASTSCRGFPHLAALPDTADNFPGTSASKGGASAQHWMLIGKWHRDACQFSGRGPSFPEFVALTLHVWTSPRRFSVGSALMDFPTFS